MVLILCNQVTFLLSYIVHLHIINSVAHLFILIVALLLIVSMAFLLVPCGTLLFVLGVAFLFRNTIALLLRDTFYLRNLDSVALLLVLGSGERFLNSVTL